MFHMTTRRRHLLLKFLEWKSGLNPTTSNKLESITV